MCIPKLKRHSPALSVAVSDACQAAAGSGAMHADQDEEVEDETMLHELSEKSVFPWFQGLSVTELGDLGKTKGTTLALS